MSKGTVCDAAVFARSIIQVVVIVPNFQANGKFWLFSVSVKTIDREFAPVAVIVKNEGLAG